MKKLVIKEFETTQADQILNFYNNFNVSLYPNIIDHQSLGPKTTITFEWVDGIDINNSDLDKVFCLIGQNHRLNFRTSPPPISSSIYKLSLTDNYHPFLTLCHGDLHPKNIIKTNSGYKLIDITYSSVDMNYTDLDYVDFFDLYNPSTHPHIIKQTSVFDAYLEGAKISLSPQTKNRLKYILMSAFINKFIDNGLKNKIDISSDLARLNTLKRIYKN